MPELISLRPAVCTTPHPVGDDTHCQLHTPAADDTCTPMTLHVGPSDCLDRECDEYATEDGEPIDIDYCSHISEELVCERHSEFTNDEWGYCIHAEPWPCQAAPTS